MGFHAYTKPVDYVLPRIGTRSHFVFDSDLVGSSTRILLEYQGGPITSTFTAANGTAVTGFLTDRGLKSDFTTDCWSRFIGEWEIQSNKARTITAGYQAIPTEAVLSADIDISVDVSSTNEAGLELRCSGANANRVQIFLGFPGARVVAYEIAGANPLMMTGTTTIVSGTTYTLRVTAVGSTFNVYLNGNLEGTFTSTVNQTTGTIHKIFTFNDTAARFDNYAVARRSLPVATTYTVRNYDGDIVVSGSVTDDHIDLPDSALTWRGHGPYGWYRLYLTGPNHGDGQWGTAYGDCTFIRIPSTSLPANGAPTLKGSGLFDRGDEVGRGVLGMGTSRYAILDSSVASATTIAGLTPALTLAKTWQTDTASAARPRRLLVAFPNGTAGNESNVTAIVAGLKSWVTAWECRNEPNFSQDATTWTTGEFAAFHTAVKAGDSNAVVIGPGNVSFADAWAQGPGGLPYFQAFLAAGGGSLCEAFSFHPYNCYNGDLATMRYTLGHVLTEMAAAGKSGYDMWMTEQGFGHAYAGIVWPQWATRFTALMYFAQACITADKMRVETTSYWYDGYDPVGGDSVYDSFPMNWNSSSGPGPQLGPVRTMSAELYGKTFTSELDFGTYGKNVYVGGVWTNGSTGAKVIGVQSSSYGANPIRLRTTGATTFTLVDPWGNTSTLTASFGNLTVPVSELPQWLRIPAGSTAALEPTDWSWGTNYCLGGTPATSSTTYFDLANIANDIHENWYAMGGPTFEENGFYATDETFPQTVQVTFGSQQINRAVIFCNAPLHNLAALVDFDLQTFDGSTWTTRKTWTGDLTRSFDFTSGTARGVIEMYWHDHYIFDYQFPSPLTIQGVRCYVRSASYGGFDLKHTSDFANNGKNGWGYYINIREIQVFNVAAAPLAPRVRNPAMGGVTG